MSSRENFIGHCAFYYDEIYVYDIILLQICLKVLRMLARRWEGKRESRERGRDSARRDTNTSTSSMTFDSNERGLTQSTSSLRPPPRMLSSPLPLAQSVHMAHTQDYLVTQTLRSPSGSWNRTCTIRRTEAVRSTFRVVGHLSPTFPREIDPPLRRWMATPQAVAIRGN